VNNSTTNNYGGGESNVNIKFDNKKFADLFDVQVEKSIGRAARKAVI
jgi:ribosomal protein L25 (general stress protein Ctc)